MSRIKYANTDEEVDSGANPVEEEHSHFQKQLLARLDTVQAEQQELRTAISQMTEGHSIIMPPRRSVENQDAPENDVPTSAELARAVTQLAQLTQALGDRLLQDLPVNGNRNGGDITKLVARRNPPVFAGKEDLLEAFKDALREKFYPEHVRTAKYEEFLHLRQGNRTVQEYYTDFINLARVALALVPDERGKAGKFIRGLNFETQKNLSVFRCQTLDGAYDRAASHCLVQQLQREVTKKGKRRNEENQQQGEKKPKYSHPGQNRNFHRKGGPRNHNGYHDQRNQNQGQRNQKVDRHYHCKGCGKDHPGVDCEGNGVKFFNCNKIGHHAFECYARKDGNGSGQNQNKNGGNNGKNVRGGNQGNNQNGNKNGGNNNAHNGNGGNGGQRRIYVINKVQAKASDVVTGTFFVHFVPALVLFDSGATNSFVSTAFIKKIGVAPTSEVKIAVKIPTGSAVACKYVHKDVLIDINGVNFPANLIEFELKDLDVVLGMDWLSAYKAKIICDKQQVILKIAEGDRVTYRGIITKPGIKLVYMLKVKKYVMNNHEAYLCMVRDLDSMEETLDQIAVVRDFHDVFLEEIPDMPPEREIEFAIDLVPGTVPISKTPYRMASKEMQELKEQLQELLDKGYI
ncbi:uncharacterized protein LOC116020274 [Ipomoea triloba]|uniref:uncharacterized protein LOC116020274 n=1 Tax=Ipomoea triloba TaxID=35885 RepID=UPI00125CF4D9|nr:uncharacterized protein LOC116020274 [Ipomoea triloba]